MFGYAGSTLASIQYSIQPLLWVLLGGAATVLGPFFGTLIMFYVVDVASSFTRANLLAVGVVLIAARAVLPRGHAWASCANGGSDGCRDAAAKRRT